MSEKVHSPSSVHSDTFTGTDLSGQPDHIVLGHSPPDHVKQMTRHLSSVEQQSGQDTNSDSGDSLFITQKCVPERRRRANQRSKFRTHRDASEQEYDTSTSEEEHRAGRKQRKKSYKAPSFTFPFLKTRLMTRLPLHQDRKLHCYAMGGYFRCTKELWESYQTGGALVASLPTVDMDGESISPMSEEEDETIEDGDIKVVEKKCFVTSKAKSSQPWYNPKKGSSKETQQKHEHSDAGYGSQRGQGKTAREKSMCTPLSKGTSSSKAKESSEVSGETESGSKCVTKAGNLPAETETGKTNRSPRKGRRAGDFIPKDNGKMLGNNSDAAYSVLSAEQIDREATEPHTREEQTCLGDNNDIECSRIKVKKGKKKKEDSGDEKCVEEGKDQSLEGAEGQWADPSASVNITEAEEAPCIEKKRENEDLRQGVDGQSDKWKEEDPVVMWETGIGGKERREKKEGNFDTDSLKTSKAAQPTTDDGHIPKRRKEKKKDPSGPSDLHQTPPEHLEAIDNLGSGDASQETMESSGFKRKKHKKKKKQSPFNDNQTDVDLSNDVATVVENTDFTVKKKTKAMSELVPLPADEESVDHTQKEKQDVELETRKKKKKKIRGDISINKSEDTMASSDYSELVCKKKKKRVPSFLSADDEEKVGQSHEEQCTPVQSASAHKGHVEQAEVSASDLAAESADVSEHLKESKGGKKKKKRSAAVPESEEREPEETSEAAVKKKKKRGRTESLTGSLESIADVGHSQTEEVVVVRKKKQKKGTQEALSAVTEHAESEKSRPNACNSLSTNQKLLTKREAKHRRSAETSCDSSLPTEHQATETLTEFTSGDVNRRKKKKCAGKNVHDRKSCIRTADAETHKSEKDRMKPPADSRFISTSSKAFPAELEASSSHCVKRKKGVKGGAKRRLYNPNKDFISGLSC